MCYYFQYCTIEQGGLYCQLEEGGLNCRLEQEQDLSAACVERRALLKRLAEAAERRRKKPISPGEWMKQMGSQAH